MAITKENLQVTGGSFREVPGVTHALYTIVHTDQTQEHYEMGKAGDHGGGFWATPNQMEITPGGKQGIRLVKPRETPQGPRPQRWRNINDILPKYDRDGTGFTLITDGYGDTIRGIPPIREGYTTKDGQPGVIVPGIGRVEHQNRTEE